MRGTDGTDNTQFLTKQHTSLEQVALFRRNEVWNFAGPTGACSARTPMRLLIDSLVAVMLAGLLASIILSDRAAEEETKDVEVATVDLHRLQREIYLQAALAEVPLSEHGFPITVDPEWFQGGLPRNPLLGPDHPWLEVADASQQNFKHPHDRMAADRLTAKFWYNPYQGIVRARVSSTLSENEALALYNQVNGCSLPNLFVDEPATETLAMQASAVTE